MLMIQNSKIYAGTVSDRINNTIKAIEEGGDIGDVVQTIIDFAIPLSVFAAAILLSFAAYKMITSKGDPEKLKDAREQIGNAVTGLLFILVSAAILILLGNIILGKS